MTVPDRINKSELPERFLKSSIAFLGRSSFEERCTAAYTEIAACKFAYTHFFISKGESRKAKTIRDRINLSKDEISQIDISNPLQAQQTIVEQLRKISELPIDTSIVIDITTFRREELLILIKEMRRLPDELLNGASFVYSIASKMGRWLSNNVRQTRPVIGYPGEMMSRRGTHLVILAGVEHHRALAAIDAYEPSNISLGIVPRDESVSVDLFQRNLELRDFIVRHFDNVTAEFDFSAKDPQAVVRSLEAVVGRRPDQNTIIAPLNTKLSTLGCAAYALKNPNVQLCYSEVEVYNAGKYSEPGEETLLVPYRSIFESVVIVA